MYMSDDTVCLGAIHLTPKHTYLPLFNDDTLELLQDALDNVELYLLYISFYILGWILTITMDIFNAANS